MSIRLVAGGGGVNGHVRQCSGARCRGSLQVSEIPSKSRRGHASPRDEQLRGKLWLSRESGYGVAEGASFVDV